MAEHLCRICGEPRDGIYCPGCMHHFLRDSREGRIPPGIQSRFFRLEHWTQYRLNELNLKEGKITEAEAKRRAAAVTREIRDLQERTLAEEAEAKQKEKEHYAHYLY